TGIRTTKTGDARKSTQKASVPPHKTKTCSVQNSRYRRFHEILPPLHRLQLRSPDYTPRFLPDGSENWIEASLDSGRNRISAYFYRNYKTLPCRPCQPPSSYT